MFLVYYSTNCIHKHININISHIPTVETSAYYISGVSNVQPFHLNKVIILHHTALNNYDLHFLRVVEFISSSAIKLNIKK